jgi:hypothetical protein
MQLKKIKLRYGSVELSIDCTCSLNLPSQHFLCMTFFLQSEGLPHQQNMAYDKWSNGIRHD